MTQLTIKVANFRKFSSPYTDGKSNITKYVFQASIKSLLNYADDFEDWFETNPRDQKISGKIPKRIKQTLLDENDYNFHHLNKGIVFSAENISFDNKTNLVKFTFSDNQIHGNVDGGHTLRIIIESKKEFIKKIDNEILMDKFVTIEVFENLDQDFLIMLAETRNTAAQVKDISLENLAGTLDSLKKILQNESFYQNILWKENDKDDDGKIKRVDARTIISLWNIFDPQIYPLFNNKEENDFKTLIRNNMNFNDMLISAYSGKQKQLELFSEKYKNIDEKYFLARKNLFLDVIKLSELIQLQINDMANKENKTYATLPFTKKPPKEDGGEQQKKQGISLIKRNVIPYVVPEGILLPILSSFRVLIKNDLINNFSEWEINPFEVWDKIGGKLVKIMLDNLRESGNSPTAYGKKNSSWNNLQAEMKIYLLGSVK